MVFVNDTLEMADRIADDLFGEEKTPEAVIEIYRLIVEQYEIKQTRARGGFRVTQVAS